MNLFKIKIYQRYFYSMFKCYMYHRLLFVYSTIFKYQLRKRLMTLNLTHRHRGN